MLALPLHANTTLLLLTTGFALICLEFNRPGLIVAGALGLLTTLLALASVLKSPHPTLAIAIFALTAFDLALDQTKPHAIIAISAALSFFAASLLLLDDPFPRKSLALAILCACAIAFANHYLARIAHRARLNKSRNSSANHLD